MKKLYDTFGYTLAMQVLQSDLYPTLDPEARAECDALIARGQGRSIAEHQQRAIETYAKSGTILAEDVHAILGDPTQGVTTPDMGGRTAMIRL